MTPDPFFTQTSVGPLKSTVSRLTDTKMPSVELVNAKQEEFEALLSLRIEAMRESLQKIGRFDRSRARERFSRSFVATRTRHIECEGKRIGFVAVRPQDDGLLLDHLYILPGSQGIGIGEAVLHRVFAEADAQGLCLRVIALKGSRSNDFYLRHGFALVKESEFDNDYIRSPRVAAQP